MPWAEVTRVSLREEFVQLAMQPGVNRRELCRRFRISPKSGYKWLARHAATGPSGLRERSRRPCHSPPVQLMRSLSASSSCGASRAIRGAGASWLSCWLRKGVRDWPPVRSPAFCAVPACWIRPLPPVSAPGSVSNTLLPTLCGRWILKATSPCSTVASVIR
jgi:transposase-like protein